MRYPLPTISVIIPALNEEANIAAAAEEVTRTFQGKVSDYELLLFNDGSSDRTGEIMDQLAAKDPHIRVTHNAHSKNLGGVYKQGLAMARCEYLMMVPGDNENPGSAILPIMEEIGKAEIVIPYTTNAHVRPWRRRIISRVYTTLINILFGNRLKYYNGTTVCRVADVRALTITTNSFAYQSEVLLKHLKAGKTYVEVGIEISPREGRDSKALCMQNVVNVFKDVALLYAEINLKRS